jgi:hypothetical protein
MELGIDSLMTMELLALCKQDLDLVLYPREVLAHPYGSGAGGLHRSGTGAGASSCCQR